MTIKFRIGLSDALRSFLDAGRIGQEEGCAAVALHARTAEHAHFEGNVEAAKKMITAPALPDSATRFPVAELAAWTVVANVILNLDGVLTKS